MAILTSNSSAQPRWSWLRIGGLSGTVLVHVLALALLAIPMALPNYRPEPPEPSYRLIETMPDPIVLPIPDEPVPLPRAHVAPVPVVAAANAADVPAPNMVAESVIPASVIPVAASVEPINAAPASVADARLAYESIVGPKYPLAALRRGEHGTVLVRVTVGRNGLPTKVEVAHSSGSRHLDKAAREAVQRWRFHTVRINGVAVEATGVIPVAFELQKR